MIRYDRKEDLMSEVNSNNQSNEEEVLQPEDLVILTDDDGTEVRYEFLDVITYSDVNYAVLVPEDSDQVEIFRMEDADEDNSTLIPVNSQETANAIFELFKTKNESNFDFQ